MTRSIADAYSQTGAAWNHGPSRVYARLAEVLIERVPGGVAGRSVLDLGAGTGVAGRAALDAGAQRVVALDVAIGQLRVDAGHRPPAVVGEAAALPFHAAALGAVVAAFSLNHLAEPTAAFAEAARILQPGGGLVASAYAADDDHPVKQVVERECTVRGWTAPGWYVELRSLAMPRLATPSRACDAASGALEGCHAEVVRVPLPELDSQALVAWRLGMAQFAPFVASLDRAERAALAESAIAALGDTSPLVRSIVVITWRKPG